MSPTQRRVAVIGCGLIGGSIAQALHGRPEVALTVFDSDPQTMAAVEAAGIPTAASARMAVVAADLVVLAFPTTALTATVTDLRTWFKSGAVVIDTGSVQGEPSTVAAVLAAIRPDVTLVPTNPMAGKAVGGFANADPQLFAGATWVVGGPETPRVVEVEVTQFVRALGAADVVSGLEPIAHDRMAAAVSHAPQLVVSALTQALARQAEALGTEVPDALFERVLRLASSPESTWVDVLTLNAGPVAEVLIRMRRHLDTLVFAGGNERELALYARLAETLRAPVGPAYPNVALAVPDDEFGAHALRMAQMVSYLVLVAADDQGLPDRTDAELDLRDRSAMRIAGPGFGDTTALAVSGINALLAAARAGEISEVLAYGRALNALDDVLVSAQRMLGELHREALPNLVVWGHSGVDAIGEASSSPLMHACFEAAAAAARSGTAPMGERGH